jgi:hypothetical protein
MNNASFYIEVRVPKPNVVAKLVVEVHMNSSCPFGVILSIWMKPKPLWNANFLVGLYQIPMD